MAKCKDVNKKILGVLKNKNNWNRQLYKCFYIDVWWIICFCSDATGVMCVSCMMTKKRKHSNIICFQPLLSTSCIVDNAIMQSKNIQTSPKATAPLNTFKIQSDELHHGGEGLWLGRKAVYSCWHTFLETTLLNCEKKEHFTNSQWCQYCSF